MRDSILAFFASVFPGVDFSKFSDDLLEAAVDDYDSALPYIGSTSDIRVDVSGDWVVFFIS